MTECVGFPVGSKVMGVGKLPLIAADIAGGVLLIVVAVGLRNGFFLRRSTPASERMRRISSRAKVVGVGRLPLIIADAGR